MLWSWLQPRPYDLSLSSSSKVSVPTHSSSFPVLRRADSHWNLTAIASTWASSAPRRQKALPTSPLFFSQPKNKSKNTRKSPSIRRQYSLSPTESGSNRMRDICLNSLLKIMDLQISLPVPLFCCANAVHQWRYHLGLHQRSVTRIPPGKQRIATCIYPAFQEALRLWKGTVMSSCLNPNAYFQQRAAEITQSNLAPCSSDPCWPPIRTKPEIHIPLQGDCSTLFKTLIPVTKPETPASKEVDKSHIQLFCCLFVFLPRFGQINSFIPAPRWFQGNPHSHHWPPFPCSEHYISASQSQLWLRVSVCYSSAPLFFFLLLCTPCSPAPCQGLWGCGPSWRHTKTDWRASKGAHCPSFQHNRTETTIISQSKMSKFKKWKPQAVLWHHDRRFLNLFVVKDYFFFEGKKKKSGGPIIVEESFIFMRPKWVLSSWADPILLSLLHPPKAWYALTNFTSLPESH